MSLFKTIKNSNIFALKDAYSPFKRYFILGVVFILLTSLTQVSLPYLFGQLIDGATKNTTGIFSNLKYISFAIFLAFLLNSIFKLIKNYLFFIFAEKTTFRIMNQVFSKLIRQPLKFYDTNLVGDLFSRINTDIALIKSIFSEQIASVIYQPFIIIFCFVNLFSINYKLTFLLILVFPPAVYFSLKLAMKVRKLSRETLNYYSSANVILQESLQLVRTIKTFNNEHIEEEKYSKALDNILRKSISTSIAKIAIEGVASFVLLLGIIIIIWYASELVATATITTGKLIEFIVNAVFIGSAYSAISIAFGTIQKSIGATERINILLNEPAEDITQVAIGDELADFNGSLKFNDVCFNYPSRESTVVLDGLNLEIRKGDKIGIIGESGGGKSTILQLLLRFYHLSNGQITIDGLNINEIPLSSYRRLFGVVSQEIKLFSGTINDNIKYGNPEASDLDVINASKISNSYDFIQKLPDKFNSLVGENGVTLSGGQRQRIAITRALLVNPKVLILDEATSALDNELESIINESLVEFMKNKTTIVLSHKLSIIMKMDRIFKVENGKLIELNKDVFREFKV